MLGCGRRHLATPPRKSLRSADARRVFCPIPYLFWSDKIIDLLSQATHLFCDHWLTKSFTEARPCTEAGVIQPLSVDPLITEPRCLNGEQLAKRTSLFIRFLFWVQPKKSRLARFCSASKRYPPLKRSSELRRAAVFLYLGFPLSDLVFAFQTYIVGYCTATLGFICISQDLFFRTCLLGPSTSSFRV